VIRWAHQGGAREAPSNTVLAMRQAIRQVPGIALELDVHRSRDGKVVVIHDRVLERTTDGFGRVRGQTATVLTTRDAGHWWADGEIVDHADSVAHPKRGHPDAHLPLLAEVLEERKHSAPHARMTIEVKARRTAVPLVDLLGDHDWGDGIITVTSFLDPFLWRVRLRLVTRKLLGRPARSTIELAPAMGYMVVFWVLAQLGIPVCRSRYARLQIPTRKGLAFATPRIVAAAHRTSVAHRVRSSDDQTMQVDVWTIDDAETMLLLRDLGVDGIMSDRPQLLHRVLEPASPPTKTAAKKKAAR
jgi:glycerophosphoryl diester phosphodiesterase